MRKQLTMKSKNIVETFNKCTSNDEANLIHQDGSIYLTGGILSKLDKNGNQSIAINGKWVKV